MGSDRTISLFEVEQVESYPAEDGLYRRGRQMMWVSSVLAVIKSVNPDTGEEIGRYEFEAKGRAFNPHDSMRKAVENWFNGRGSVTHHIHSGMSPYSYEGETVHFKRNEHVPDRIQDTFLQLLKEGGMDKHPDPAVNQLRLSEGLDRLTDQIMKTNRGNDSI